MNAEITPSKLSGTIPAVASKSDVHRAMICAALADRETTLTIGATNNDIETTASCLVSLGAKMDRDEPDVCRVRPIRPDRSVTSMDCSESGSTLRFLLPLIPALRMRRTVRGSGRLPERPISDLLDVLSAHGAHTVGRSLPLDIFGALESGIYSIPGHVSSQYITGMMFALPLLPGESRISLTSPLQSASYVEMTLRTIRRFGVVIEETEDGWRIPGGQSYTSPGDMKCEGDWSNAAFFLAAGALSGEGRSITVTGLSPDSPQGDRVMPGVLRDFGADVRQDGDSVTVTSRPLHGITVDVGDIPDLVPIIAVCGACAEGETRIVNASRLRLKESDRLQAMRRALTSVGAECTELPDALIIRGRQMTGGVVDCVNDHRIVMSMAIAAMSCSGPTTLLGANACAKSYPKYFEDLKTLGGRYHVV